MTTAIEINSLSKRFGRVLAVDDLSFEVRAGRVTGFLGPNGAGKSTTLRMVLDLIRRDAGSASFGGRRYAELPHPSSHVGVVLEDASFHPRRTGRDHLRILAVAGRHPSRRVDEVLDQVGLTPAAGRRVKGYSMGMRQRLAIAAALLGDPEVLILDEPANGLDPPGIRWMRDLLRAQAARGRAVLVSSHLLSEVAQSVDDVVVIARGALRASGPLETVLGKGGHDGTVTRARAADLGALAAVLVDVFASDLSAVFIIVLAVVGITGEWRHRTITGALLAAPDRIRFLAAKTIAFAAAGLVLSVLVSFAVALLGFVILTVRHLPLPGAGELAEHIARGALVAALLGAFGVAIGALVRNQIVAIVSLLLLALVVEPAVLTLAPDVGRFGPVGALATAV